MRERYGRTKVTKIRAAQNKLREAIQKEGTPAIREAWDRMEQWVDIWHQTPEAARTKGGE